jgi:hypothetical protein
MLLSGDTFKIGDVVIERVAVFVMDMTICGDWAVVRFPNLPMKRINPLRSLAIDERRVIDTRASVA